MSGYNKIYIIMQFCELFLELVYYFLTCHKYFSNSQKFSKSCYNIPKLQVPTRLPEISNNKIWHINYSKIAKICYLIWYILLMNNSIGEKSMSWQVWGIYKTIKRKWKVLLWSQNNIFFPKWNPILQIYKFNKLLWQAYNLSIWQTRSINSFKF